MDLDQDIHAKQLITIINGFLQEHDQLGHQMDVAILKARQSL